MDNIWLDEIRWNKMGLDEIESDQRGSGDKRIDQMISDELRWHMESDKIGWEQMKLYDIG